MKKKQLRIFVVILFIAGLSLLLYPVIANQWNNLEQSKSITAYSRVVSTLEEEDFSREWETAKRFNEDITYNFAQGDAFGAEEALEDSEYWNTLNIAGDGVMGYISIPKINIKLSIYHGVAEDVLKTGVGHLEGTGLPVGGSGTHSVLAGHRGLPSAKLFTDIDQLQCGDMFYIHILDETLAYQVDMIYDMVDKNDVKTLESAMQIVEGQDYVTLFTCTPYGVNSHRLLVRGTRVEYLGEDEVPTALPEVMVESVQNYYMFYVIIGACVAVVWILVLRRIKKKKAKETIVE